MNLSSSVAMRSYRQAGDVKHDIEILREDLERLELELSSLKDDGARSLLGEYLEGLKDLNKLKLAFDAHVDTILRANEGHY